VAVDLDGVLDDADRAGVDVDLGASWAGHLTESEAAALPLRRPAG
jgi:hypothetical protein